MILKGFKFEFEILPDVNGNNEKLIILKIKNNEYYLEYKKGKKISKIEITQNIDTFCQGLQKMNIYEWNQKCFDEPWDWYPGYYWKLSIAIDDVSIECSGKDNLPENWSTFRKLLCEIGLVDLEFPF